jgi:hypothetical protein
MTVMGVSGCWKIKGKEKTHRLARMEKKTDGAREVADAFRCTLRLKRGLVVSER